MRRFFGFWCDVLREAMRHHLTRMSAALAFFGLFAVPPLLLFALVIAGQIFGEASAREGLLEQAEAVAGEHGRAAAEDMIESMPPPATGAPFTQGVSAITLFLAATAGFNQLESCLNQILGRRRRHRGIALVLSALKRILGFGLVVSFSLLLLGLATVGVALQLSPETWIQELPESVRPYLGELPHRVGLFFVAFTGLSVIYKALPEGPVPWRSALLGALVAAILLLAIKGGTALYLQHSWRNAAFGAASSVVGVLISFYVAANAVLLGAIVAKVRRARAAAAEKAQASSA